MPHTIPPSALRRAWLTRRPIAMVLAGALLGCGGGAGHGAVTEGAAAPAPASTPARWTLLWSDEFNAPAGSPPNPAHWGHDLGNAEAGGWGNHELQYYTASAKNAFHDGQGHLALRAEQAANPGPCWNSQPCAYTSARILTRDKVSFTYGKVEARIKVPAGKGLWPAFWSLGAGPLPWPQAGELDIMEYVGKVPDATYGTAHGPGYSAGAGIGQPRSFSAPVADDFHVFTLIKRPNEVIWQVDGIDYHRVTPAALPAGAPWVFERPFFLILNLAVGGDWPGPPDASTVFPATMLVDWVRIYQEG